MTQEDKELLLKDLCTRLPYGVKIRMIHHEIKGGDPEYVDDVFSTTHYNMIDYDDDNYEFLPYLRPMSSMTEEEKRHISKMMCLRTYDDGVVHDMTYPVYTPYYVMEDCLSYLRSIHVDYSGLIEKDLALAASEGMYK